MNPASRIKEKAVELGFDLVGIAAAGPAPTVAAYENWLRAGHQAGMAWLEKRERRTDPRRVLPGARSVVVVGLSYFVENPPPHLWNDPSRGRVARYAWGPDYHDVLTPRLEALAGFIRREGGRDARTRHYVDTGPVLERAWAAKAGLGFVGRNSMLIHPGYGSYVFLGEIITTVALDPDEAAAGDPAGIPFQDEWGHRKVASCGSCRRCMDICPTHAIPSEYVIDSRRCISYLTIENKGAIPAALRPGIGNWVFGCDACQEICPWVHRHARPSSRPFLAFEPARMAPPLLDLMGLDEAAFRARFRGTPIRRAKRRGLLRNVAVALGNWGASEARPVLEKALRDPEPLVREHAAWALARIPH